MASPTPPREIVYKNKVGDFRLYADGTCERDETFVPASHDPSTGVTSKDIRINPNLTARIYLPNAPAPKLPLLLYFHGGAFFKESPFSPLQHPYLNSLASNSNSLAVSLHYRRVPEHPLTACYEDSHAALQWAASHLSGAGPEPWLNERADLARVYLMGDSAGGNIAHHVAMRVGRSGGPRVEGIVLVHPYFWGSERIKMEEGVDPETVEWVNGTWAVACPEESGLGCDDPWINPVRAGGLEALGCERVLVCVADKDVLRGRGWEYFTALRGCGWGGEVELLESVGRGHVFHLYKPECDEAREMMCRVVSFLNRA